MALHAIIVGALLAEYVLTVWAAVLNLRAMSPSVPAEFQEIFDRERYARSQEYTRVRTRFGFLHTTLSLVVLLVFWHLGGFNLLDRWVRAPELGPILSGLLYVGALAVASTLLGLPFRLYATFVIEERFGFNRTAVRTFVADLVKGLLLGAILGGALLTVVMWLFASAGPLAWVLCWAVSTAFIFFIQLIAPTWIMPLFNKFTPLEAGNLRAAVLEYARRIGYPLEGIFVIDGSRRSSKANAFFGGLGKHKRVALFDTLVAEHTTDELVAVVAHEVGHYKRRHIVIGSIFAVAQLGLMFFLLSFFIDRPSLFETFFVEERSVYVGLTLFALLYQPLALVLSVLGNALSRKNEFEADEFAAQTTGQADPMIDALKKLSAGHLVNLTPHKLEVLLHYSHPPVLQRIEALRAQQAWPRTTVLGPIRTKARGILEGCLRCKKRRRQSRTRSGGMSPSSRTSITARRPSSMRCCTKAACFGQTSASPSAPSTASTWSASAGSPSWRRIPPSTFRTFSSTSSTPLDTPTSGVRSSGR
jgi:STE24 endopeptidase